MDVIVVAGSWLVIGALAVGGIWSVLNSLFGR
jgi:hypothetical protein